MKVKVTADDYRSAFLHEFGRAEQYERFLKRARDHALDRMIDANLAAMQAEIASKDAKAGPDGNGHAAWMRHHERLTKIFAEADALSLERFGPSANGDAT